jgi:hypothetical protein
MSNFDRMQPEMGFETFESEQFEFSGYGETGSPFNEAEEMELAAELLGVSSEAEMDQFLGNLFRRAAQTVGGFIKSPTGQALGGILKGAARQALPIVGQAVGTYFGGPAGGAAGGKIASTAGRIFGLELEGLSQEDQEFETAKQFVRLAGAAATNAATAPPSTPPAAVAKQAVMAAAKQFAPGLLRPGLNGSPLTPGRGRSGRWFRRGNTIILQGI